MMMGSGYCPDNMPLLENVTEEMRRSQDPGALSDYYFRDSFEHSSSESGFAEHRNHNAHHPHRTANAPHSASNPAASADYMPLMATGNNHHPHQSSSNVNHQHSTPSAQNSQLVNQQNESNSAKHQAKRFSIVHAFVPSFVFVVATLVVVTVVVLESESELWAPIRGWPEMISLRYQYYQPLKEFIIKQFLSK